VGFALIYYKLVSNVTFPRRDIYLIDEIGYL